jgi:hypothetical protein
MVPMNNKPMSRVSVDTIRSAEPGSVKYTNTADANVIVMAMRNQARPASGFISRHQMTSHITIPVRFLERRYDLFADLAHISRAAGMECATGWQLQQAGHIRAA